MNRDHSELGFVWCADTNAVATGKYFGVYVVADAVISAITFQDGYLGDSAITGDTLAAGQYHPMRFTTLTLTSGTVRCEREV